MRILSLRGSSVKRTADSVPALTIRRMVRAEHDSISAASEILTSIRSGDSSMSFSPTQKKAPSEEGAVSDSRSSLN